MDKPISVFIMDVSNSSEHPIANELSAYLQALQKKIESFSSPNMFIKATHRAGDELVVISKGFATAYIIAFYICRIWKYEKHTPYFGLSCGFTADDVKAIDIETWIHPIMKHARLANDSLKDGKNRHLFQFSLKNTNTIHENEWEKLLNTTVMLQQELTDSQTMIQSQVLSLYLILGQQNKISTYLQRTKSTISSHMKNGKVDSIIHAFTTIIDVLNSLDNETPKAITDNLQLTIKQSIQNDLQTYFRKKRNES